MSQLGAERQPPWAKLLDKTMNATSEAPIDPRLPERIRNVIAKHVAEKGRRDWDEIREHPDFAHVIGKASGEKGRRKFWRWVRAVTEPTPPDVTRPHEARAPADAALAIATDRARKAAEQHLPTAPSPSYMMRVGAQGPRNIDFLAAVGQIWADAERLRDLAMEMEARGFSRGAGAQVQVLPCVRPVVRPFTAAGRPGPRRRGP